MLLFAAWSRFLLVYHNQLVIWQSIALYIFVCSMTRSLLFIDWAQLLHHFVVRSKICLLAHLWKLFSSPYMNLIERWVNWSDFFFQCVVVLLLFCCYCFVYVLLLLVFCSCCLNLFVLFFVNVLFCFSLLFCFVVFIIIVFLVWFLWVVSLIDWFYLVKI